MTHLATVYRVLATLSFAQAINWATVGETTHALVLVALGSMCFVVGERAEAR